MSGPSKRTPSTTGVRCMLMRGGTSKGAYFLADDLPVDAAVRDDVLMRIMGTPDPRQIDGVGGAHPLTSKVAVVSRCPDAQADVDYLFLQVGVEKAFVTDQQNCGNLLAGVGPFAIERGLVAASGDIATVRIRMLNTGGVATATFPVQEGSPVYEGDCAIAGVPGTAAPIRLDFEHTEGSSCGALLPTGHVVDVIEGVEVTCIDNGMPVVVLRAEDLDVVGDEACEDLEANEPFRRKLEAIRLAAGPLMNLGDVRTATVPKMTLVSKPRAGGTLCTRTFIPHRCHDAIGVLGAVTVATAALTPGTPAAAVAELGDDSGRVVIEHPTGTLDATTSGILRTARKLMDGRVFPRS